MWNSLLPIVLVTCCCAAVASLSSCLRHIRDISAITASIAYGFVAACSDSFRTSLHRTVVAVEQ